MNTKAKNLFIGTGTFLCATFALLGMCVGGAKPASAAELVTNEKASLVLPASYEQYLALNSPKDIAFSESYIAIADGNVLYLYDRAANAYRETTLAENRTIDKLGFAGERLFVAESGGRGNFFYEYNFANDFFEPQSFNCTTFCINGDTLYTATVGTEVRISAYSISSLEEDPRDLGRIVMRDNSSPSTPSMTVLNDTLYCTINDIVYSPNADTGTFDGGSSFYLSAGDPSLAMGVQAACAHDGELYYTAVDGLYRTDLATNTATKLLSGTGFGALTSYDGMLYAVRGSSVVEIDLAGGEAKYTGYEIAAASSSENRLAGAVDVVRAGNLLVAADAANRRISVSTLVCTQNGNTVSATETIPCLDEAGIPYAPELVATDGSMIAVSADNVIYLYKHNNGSWELKYRHDADITAVRGLVCVYGACYYITEYGYGKAEKEFATFYRSGNTPKALAADVYGTLYVVNTDGEVRAYSESEFIDKSEDGGPVDMKLPKNFTSLRADFEGNLYCLSSDTVYCNGVAMLAIDKLSDSSKFVYKSMETPHSFALGYEDDEIFLLYDNYIVKTNPDLLDIPTLSEIDANGVYESVFAPHGQDGLLIDIPAGTIGIRTDLTAIRENAPAYFPYESYYRTETDMRGLLLTTKDRYALVVLYEISDSSRVFTESLFRLEADTLVPTEDYWNVQTSDMYLSNAVSSYFYPCLHPALADDTLTRGTAVKVLGYVEAPERTYAYVEYIDPVQSYDDISLLPGSNHTKSYGFVPANYLTEVAPVPTDEGAFESAWLKANRAGVEFVADDGSTILVTERTRAEFTPNADGTYTARITDENGKVYRAIVSANMIDRGESDALRISLIIILTILAVGIIGGYFYLLPRKRDNGTID